MLPWSCSLSGDCCRAVGHVVMTPQERDVLLTAVTPERAATLTWIDWPKNGMVALKAAPCPLLNGNLCSVHPVKPMNCRRWGCFRPDPTIEPLEPDHGFLGSPCTRERFYASRGVRQQMQAMQKKAQKWGRRHGWTGTET